MKKMIKMLWITALIGFSTCTLANNADLGTVVGGIAGGIIGNNIGHGSGRSAATIGGAVIGSLVGNQMGNSADETDNYHRAHCYRYSHWESRQYPSDYYPPRYINTFIGRDGRLCRHSVLTNEYGDRVYATYCCYRMTPNNYCSRWLRVSS